MKPLNIQTLVQQDEDLDLLLNTCTKIIDTSFFEFRLSTASLSDFTKVLIIMLLNIVKEMKAVLLH